MRLFQSTGLLLMLVLQLSIQSTISQDDDYNSCPENFSGFVAGPGCVSYVICSNGVQSGAGMPCQDGTLFNEDLSLCDFEENVQCDTTALPTRRPTRPPTVPPTPRIEPTTPAPSLPPNTRSPSSNTGVEDALDNASWDINNKILLYESGFEGGWLPSTVYRYDTMMKALQLMYLEGVGEYTFYMGEDVHGIEGVKVALVNLAAFLAQSMKETIKYNSCDENNWDIIEGKYPLSNACGQLEQSYQDYVCPEGMEHMQCAVDPDMELTASTTAMWYGAPGPLFCGPKSKYNFTGYWDYSFQCDFPWKDPPEYCPDYPGQKGGRYDNSEPVENRNNRTDVEGCCWWGRGVIQTTGVCNFGILNYYIGKKAADEGRDARYPDIDFCKDPGSICSRDDHKELKWIAGFFYWMKSVQTYDSGWNYISNLKAFVSGGMEDGTFIDAVSGIVNRGCHNPPCGTGSLDGGSERKENFKKVLEVLFEQNGDPRTRRSTYAPTITVTPEDTDALIESVPDNDSTGFISDVTTYENEEISEEWVEDEEDWSDIAPEESDILLSDDEYEEEEEEEEDWSEVQGGGSTVSNLYCGENQTHAARNCVDEGNSCPDGICRGDLKCYMVSDCGSHELEDAGETTSPSPAPYNTSDNGKTPIPTFDTTLTTPAPISIDSQETSKGGFDIKNTFFCGVTRADAATSCSKRCRSGSRGECPSGMSCFGYTPCPTHITADEYDATSVDDTDTPSPAATPIIADTKFPSSKSNLGITQNYCAKSLDDLSTTCAHAITCNDGEPECPTGLYCWGDRLCPGDGAAFDDENIESTPVPSLVALETRSPSQTPILLTLSPVITESVLTNEEDQIGDKPIEEPIQLLLCATTIQELETHCNIAQECNTGPCPSGTYCFPFDCTASSAANQIPDQAQSFSIPTAVPILASTAEQSLCPPTYTGWLSLDCDEYWECFNGLAGAIFVCPPGKKFDKVVLECNSEDVVNDFCYGPPTSSTNDEQAELDTLQQPISVTDTDNSSANGGVCQEGRSGWEAAPGCREYYWCDNGIVADAFHDCGEDLLFDSELELCNFKDLVECSNSRVVETNIKQPLPSPRSASPTSSPFNEDKPGLSSNAIGDQGEKTWPESTAAPTLRQELVVENNEDMPPWLAHMVKESDSSARCMMTYFSGLWVILTMLLHLHVI